MAIPFPKYILEFQKCFQQTQNHWKSVPFLEDFFERDKSFTLPVEQLIFSQPSQIFFWIGLVQKPDMPSQNYCPGQI